MSDLRDHPADTDTARRADCHADRPHKARGLCPGCYEHHMDRGTLDRYPRTHLTRAEFVAAYTQLRAEGRTVRYIAYRLGITFDGLNKAYYRAVHAGDLTPDRGAA